MSSIKEQFKEKLKAVTAALSAIENRSIPDSA